MFYHHYQHLTDIRSYSISNMENRLDVEFKFLMRLVKHMNELPLRFPILVPQRRSCKQFCKFRHLTSKHTENRRSNFDSIFWGKLFKGDATYDV